MQEPKRDFATLLDEIRGLIDGKGSRDEKLMAVCRLLHDEVANYDWVGFYVADPEARVLQLGPYIGEPTEHERIPFGRGVCGQAAERGETVLVQDVTEELNYLSCSPLVRSEIVVPIFRGGRAVAQIDVDSHRAEAFSEKDRVFLTDVCERVSQLFA